MEKDSKFVGFWNDAVHTVRKVNYPTHCNRYTEGPHAWHVALQDAFDIHPVVQRIIDEGVRPKNWGQLLLEWPHVSVEDQTQVAYTRDERAGADFRINGSARQTRTSLGKYLSRHWPHVPDHTRRDWASLHTADKFEIVTGVENVIMALEQGPRSCMVSRYGSIPFDEECNGQMRAWMDDPDENDEPDWDLHPYSVYLPKYGWSMAVRRNGAKVLGRAMVWVKPSEPDTKLFVRSYARGRTDNDCSETDTALEAWLRTQDYTRCSQWPAGAKFRKMDHPTECGIMMPYLDGSDCTGRRVTERSDCMVRDDAGLHTCDCTDGQVESREEEETVGDCEHCGDTVYENSDYTWAGRDEDDLVCDHCLSHHYVFVRGEGSGYRRNYTEYWARDDNAEQVHNQVYQIDTDYPPEDVVCLANGDWAETDDVTDINDEYYLIDDDEVIVVEEEHPDTGSTYALKDDCWEDHAGNWHRDDIEMVELDGEWYTAEEAQAITQANQLELELETETEGETE